MQKPISIIRWAERLADLHLRVLCKRFRSGGSGAQGTAGSVQAARTPQMGKSERNALEIMHRHLKSIYLFGLIIFYRDTSERERTKKKIIKAVLVYPNYRAYNLVELNGHSDNGRQLEQQLWLLIG